MFEATRHTRPLSERKAMQQQYGAQTLPLQDLCYATYTTIQAGETILVDVIATDDAEAQAILSCRDEERGERVIWHASRDQDGAPGTWLWTPEQQEAARKNPVRIDDAENEFADDEEADRLIQVAPLHPDRRTEILLLGLYGGMADAEVQEKLQAEGLRTDLPAGYRTTWSARESQPGQPTHPAKTLQRPTRDLVGLTFSGKSRAKGKKRRR